LNVEKFRTLKKVEKGEGRKKIVPWDEIIESLRGQVVSFEDVKKLVLKYKNKFHYSEWYRIVQRMQDKLKIPVEVRRDEDGTLWYGIDLE